MYESPGRSVPRRSSSAAVTASRRFVPSRYALGRCSRGRRWRVLLRTGLLLAHRTIPAPANRSAREAMERSCPTLAARGTVGGRSKGRIPTTPGPLLPYGHWPRRPGPWRAEPHPPGPQRHSARIPRAPQGVLPWLHAASLLFPADCKAANLIVSQENLPSPGGNLGRDSKVGPLPLGRPLISEEFLLRNGSGSREQEERLSSSP